MSDANLRWKSFQELNNAGQMSSYGNVIISLSQLPVPIAEYIYIPMMLLPYKKNTSKLFYRPVILKYISKWIVWYHFKSLLTLSFNLP